MLKQLLRNNVFLFIYNKTKDASADLGYDMAKFTKNKTVAVEFQIYKSDFMAINPTFCRNYTFQLQNIYLIQLLLTHVLMFKKQKVDNKSGEWLNFSPRIKQSALDNNP